MATFLPKSSVVTYDLMPGDVALALAGEQLKTLLGSCVSVILTDQRRTMAAMCHIVHVGQPNAYNTAYGVCAMDAMFARLRSIGATPKLCQAYVYGGGNMFTQLFSQQRHVGISNVDWVLDFLHDEQIAILGHCLGGNGYRKVSWTVGLGEPTVEVVLAETGVRDGD